MKDAPRQLVFDLPHRPALGHEDFLAGPSNAAALAIVDQWPNWPHWAVVVEGPAHSGKSHLGQVWRLKSGAEAVCARDLDQDAVEGLRERRALLVENLEEGVADERVLFHLLNLAREQKMSILMTTRVAPGELKIALPDLRSRLRAVPRVEIGPPDDAILGAVLVKHFADRQLSIDPSVVSYLLVRLDRSFAAALEVVEEIDRRSLATHRRVTRQLAGEAIVALGRDSAT